MYVCVCMNMQVQYPRYRHVVYPSDCMIICLFLNVVSHIPILISVKFLRCIMHPTASEM